MEQSEIIRMALEAGAIQVDGKIAFYEDDLERFAALVAAHEREECEKVCEKVAKTCSINTYPAALDCASAIHQRGVK